jgi:hypothetical protein
MTVRLTSQGEIALEGRCAGEDAEILLQHLAALPGARVDLRACGFAHTAVLQVLLAGAPRVLGPPAGPAVRDWFYPILQSA